MNALISGASMTYLVQPEIAELLHRPELRLYVVDGQFLCGGKCCGCAQFLFLKFAFSEHRIGCRRRVQGVLLESRAR